MANDTRIEYKQRGFWIPEGFMVILCEYICKAFERNDLKSYSQSLQSIYVDCHANRGGGRTGSVEILLDDIITEESDRIELFNVFKIAKYIILSKGSELRIITLDEIEDNKIHNDLTCYWSLPIKTQSLVATLELIEQLLDETFTHTNNFGVYYIGFPNPTGQDEI